MLCVSHICRKSKANQRMHKVTGKPKIYVLYLTINLCIWQFDLDWVKTCILSVGA
jgi:hypothetical protein